MRLQWTPSASRNLEAIEAYIGEDNPLAAVDTVLEILRQVDVLRDHPRIGRPGRVEGTRELVITGLPFYEASAVNPQIHWFDSVQWFMVCLLLPPVRGWHEAVYPAVVHG